MTAYILGWGSFGIDYKDLWERPFYLGVNLGHASTGVGK